MNDKNATTGGRRAGVLGTVIFHLLVAIALAVAGISRETAHRETGFAIELEDAEVPRQPVDGEPRETRDIPSPVAVNEEVAGDADRDIERYIAAIREELRAVARDDGQRDAGDEARRLADSLQEREDHLSRRLDSLQSVARAGGSSVTYRLAGRHKITLPVPVFRCEFGGTVVVSISVDPRGTVVRARVVDAASKDDPCLRETALDAATRARFNGLESAPARQEGTITYHFVRQ
ncbi:MAG: energy transducer TonB [Odoribacteraceae bacterium]|jgi:TonB family protein|nr:energy transducer TonB [Odoribacteraceae bacterium]